MAAPPRRTTALDPERLRADFPALDERIQGHELVYLDNAAMTQVPSVVLEAILTSYRREHANVHRSAHTLSGRATEAYEGARERVRRFFGAASSDEIVFVRGTTEAINLVAHAWGDHHIQAGDVIVATAMEHHSNLVPWQELCRRTGATLCVVPLDAAGNLQTNAWASCLTSRTKLVAVTHVSNAVGTINPIRQIASFAHDVGALVLVDGAQSAARLPVDVQALGCDFYACSGHKMYGPSGIGVLYGRRDLLHAMPPWQTGGGMVRSVTLRTTTMADPPQRFEAGTPNVAGAIGLGVAIEYLEAIGMMAIEAHERNLVRDATDRLSRIAGLKIVGSAPDKLAVCAFVIAGIHAHDLCTVLDQQGVAVRAGHHCAQPVIEHFGVGPTVRASFGLYNTERDIDRLIEAVERSKEVFAR